MRFSLKTHYIMNIDTQTYWHTQKAARCFVCTGSSLAHQVFRLIATGWFSILSVDWNTVLNIIFYIFFSFRIFFLFQFISQRVFDFFFLFIDSNESFYDYVVSSFFRLFLFKLCLQCYTMNANASTVEPLTYDKSESETNKEAIWGVGGG